MLLFNISNAQDGEFETTALPYKYNLIFLKLLSLYGFNLVHEILPINPVHFWRIMRNSAEIIKSEAKFQQVFAHKFKLRH